MIDPMYRVEHRGFTVDPSGSRSYSPDGAVYENFSGTHIAWFHRTEPRTFCATLYFIKGGGVKDGLREEDLSKLCRYIWKRYWDSLSWWEKVERRLFAHRAWIAVLITSVIASSITLAASHVVNQVLSGSGPG